MAAEAAGPRAKPLRPPYGAGAGADPVGGPPAGAGRRPGRARPRGRRGRPAAEADARSRPCRRPAARPRRRAARGPGRRRGRRAGRGAGLDGGALKDVALTRRCFRQPDGRWWFRIDVTEDHLAGGPCAIPSGFAAYLGMSPGESRTVRCATGELTLSWQARPTLEAIRPLLIEAGAQVGGHLFVTVTEDGMLRARHLPAATGADKTAQALRLVGYTASGGTMDQALRVDRHPRRHGRLGAARRPARPAARAGRPRPALAARHPGVIRDPRPATASAGCPR